MRTRVALVAVGAVLIAYAMVGVLTDADADPIGMLVFLLAVLVGHDLLWMPVALHPSTQLIGSTTVCCASPARSASDRSVVRPGPATVSR